MCDLGYMVQGALTLSNLCNFLIVFGVLFNQIGLKQSVINLDQQQNRRLSVYKYIYIVQRT